MRMRIMICATGLRISTCHKHGGSVGRMSRSEEKLRQKYDREGRNTSSMDPKMLSARVFIGNLAADKVTRQDVMKLFEPYGKVLGVSLHKSYGFVQFENEKDAREAVKVTHGKTVEGLRVDVNIATERRKEPASDRPRRGGGGGRRGPRSPSPPFRPSYHPHDRFEMDRPHMRWGERGWRGGGGSPPPMGGYHDREHDPYFDRYPPPPPHMRDHYGRPRDDPYERYPPPRERFGPPAARDFYSSPREGFPPYPRDRYPYDYPPPSRGRGSPPPNFERGVPEYDRREWEREREKRVATVAPTRAAEVGGGEGGEGEGRRADMVIIVINRQQREYAAVVSTRVRELGLTVDTEQLSPTVSLADALDSAAQEGLLYAVIITSQHEMHSSVTLTILHGRNPQEHKNMPLEDALSLIAKDFDHYTMSGRVSSRRPAPSVDVNQLLGKAASGTSLSSGELTAVISALQKQKQRGDTPQLGAAPAEKLETNNPEDIQRQQADLQAKILSLLGSSAVVPSSGPSSSSSSSAAAATGRSLSTNYDSTPRGMTSSGGGGGGVSYPQHSYSSSSSGYHSGYGSSSLDTKNSGTYGGGGGGGEGGYGGAYNYR